MNNKRNHLMNPEINVWDDIWVNIESREVRININCNIKVIINFNIVENIHGVISDYTFDYLKAPSSVLAIIYSQIKTQTDEKN